MRNSQLEADGIVGEVVFPNTVPPFFPSFVLFARPPKPEEYEHRLAGIRAHNRWLADFCARFPERRAGIGQIFLNDVDDAIDDVRWINEHGLRGGVLISAIPPDVDYVEAALRPGVRTAVGGVRRPRRAGEQPRRHRPARTTASTRSPTCSTSPRCRSTRSARSCSCCSRACSNAIRELKFVMTEMGCAWLPPMLERFDALITQINADRCDRRAALHRRAQAAAARDRVLPPELLGRREPARARRRGRTRRDRHRPVHVGERLPARRGHVPVHARAPAPAVPRHRPAELQQLLAGNAARLYDFSPRRARAARGEVRPDGRRDRRNRSTRCPRTRTRPSLKAVGRVQPLTSVRAAHGPAASRSPRLLAPRLDIEPRRREARDDAAFRGAPHERGPWTTGRRHDPLRRAPVAGARSPRGSTPPIRKLVRLGLGREREPAGAGATVEAKLLQPREPAPGEQPARDRVEVTDELVAELQRAHGSPRSTCARRPRVGSGREGRDRDGTRDRRGSRPPRPAGPGNSCSARNRTASVC